MTDMTKPVGEDEPRPNPAPAPGGFPPPAPGGQPAQGGYPQGGFPPAGPPAQGGYPPAGPPMQGPPPGYGAHAYGGLALPPGVELASHGRRIGAYFLAIPLGIVTLGIGYLIWGLIVWGKGTSPALKVLGMKCVDVNTGQVVGFGTMALRDIVGGIAQGILSFITLIISFVMFLTGEQRQSLPDKIASTAVVYDPNGVLG